MSVRRATADQAVLTDDRAAQQAERELAARTLALLRVLLLPIVFAADRLVAHPTQQFDLIFVVACVYSALVIALTWAGRGVRLPPGLIVACDLALVGALTYESGGAFSQLRAAFLAIPLAAAVLLPARQTAAVAGLTGFVYVLVALHPAARGSTPLDTALAQGLYVLWTGGAAVLLSSLLGRRKQRIGALAAARGRLVAQAVEAEERARKRLADDLHDHAVQNLLAARQDVAEAREGDAAALKRADHALLLALGQLRSAVRELHPYLLDHLDLPAALETIVYEQAERSGCEITVDVDPDAAGVEDRLIASIVRELVRNVVTHAAASHIAVRLARHGSSLVLEVSDDGCGFTREEQLAALRSGHIGLASTRERVEALGGTFTIDSTLNAGTRVRCEIPPARTGHGSGDRMTLVRSVEITTKL